MPKHPLKEFQFKKGQSGNPSGKPKVVFTAEELRKRIAKALSFNKEQLAEILHDKKSTSLDLVLASVIAKAIKDGDINKMEYLFNRSIGKVKDTLDVTQNILTDMSREEILKKAQQAIKVLEGKDDEQP